MRAAAARARPARRLRGLRAHRGAHAGRRRDRRGGTYLALRQQLDRAVRGIRRHARAARRARHQPGARRCAPPTRTRAAAVDPARLALGDGPAVQHRRAGPGRRVRARRARRRLPRAARGQRRRLRRAGTLLGTRSSPRSARATCAPSSTASPGAGPRARDDRGRRRPAADRAALRRRARSRSSCAAIPRTRSRWSRCGRGGGATQRYAFAGGDARRRRPVRRARLEAERVRRSAGSRHEAPAAATGCVTSCTARPVPASRRRARRRSAGSSPAAAASS